MVVLSIMDRRSKLLGMETAQVSITVETEQAPQRAVLAGADQAAAADAFDPETEARQLLELMGSSGVLPQAKVAEILGQEVQRAGSQPELPSIVDDGVIRDAEIVE